MIKKILTTSALLASFTAGAANCNLENIKGNWIWYLPGSDFTQQINQQCSVNIAVARGNSPYATVTGLCTDLVTGYVGTVLPGSTVSFVGKSCNLVGTFITNEVPPVGANGPSSIVTSNLNVLVATNKQSLSGAWNTNAPINPALTNLVASGSMTGQVGSIAEPINTIQNVVASGAPVTTTVVSPVTPPPPCPGNSCNAPGKNR
ncbi:MAG: hypothetical protein RLZZ627_63 [Pseudomonadota bacterium]|jgi:hypothetical protein